MGSRVPASDITESIEWAEAVRRVHAIQNRQLEGCIEVIETAGEALTTTYATIARHLHGDELLSDAEVRKALQTSLTLLQSVDRISQRLSHVRDSLSRASDWPVETTKWSDCVNQLAGIYSMQEEFDVLMMSDDILPPLPPAAQGATATEWFD
jgi:hypothetical protein